MSETWFHVASRGPWPYHPDWQYIHARLLARLVGLICCKSWKPWQSSCLLQFTSQESQPTMGLGTWTCWIWSDFCLHFVKMVLLALNAGDETNRQRTAEQGKEINHARGRNFCSKVQLQAQTTHEIESKLVILLSKWMGLYCAHLCLSASVTVAIYTMINKIGKRAPWHWPHGVWHLIGRAAGHQSLAENCWENQTWLAASWKIPELMEVYSWENHLQMRDLRLPCSIARG